MLFNAQGSAQNVDRAARAVRRAATDISPHIASPSDVSLAWYSAPIEFYREQYRRRSLPDTVDRADAVEDAVKLVDTINGDGRHVVPHTADRGELLDLGDCGQSLDDRRSGLRFDLQRAQSPYAALFGTPS